MKKTIDIHIAQHARILALQRLLVDNKLIDEEMIESLVTEYKIMISEDLKEAGEIIFQ